MGDDWEHMSTDQKLDHLKRLIEGFINHYNSQVVIRSGQIEKLNVRLDEMGKLIKGKT